MKFGLKIMLCVILSGCGYQLQGKQNPLKNLGVERIYISQFRNSTYRPGIEQLFSSAMVREIQKSRAFVLVNSEKEADAVLSGEITSEESVSLSPKSLAISTTKTVNVASEYRASVNCLITLKDKSDRIIFSQTATGDKNFPGAARIGDQGATAPLVNDSEQRLAVQFLASQMMASVYQRMVDIF